MVFQRQSISIAAVVVAVGALMAIPTLLDERGGNETSAEASAGASSGDGERPAASEPTVSSESAETTTEPELAVGEATAAQVDDLTTLVAPGRERSATGAVEAFTSDATWLLGSSAAERNPVDAVREISDVLNVADAEMLERVPRVDLEFRAVDGAYRVLGYSGRESAPDQVMVEIAAPVSTSEGERWLVAGGVVAWVEGRWQLTSLRPREISQPTESLASATDMSVADQGAVLDGLGWVTFANAVAE